MRFLLCAALLALCTPATAQISTTDSFLVLSQEQAGINSMGLKILAAWGTLNIATGIAATRTADDEEARRFHQMNAFWGGVNLALAGTGLLRARHDSGKVRIPADAFRHYQRDRRIFAINAGLDVLYAGTGAYLVHRGRQPTAAKPALLRGYGKSLVLQGAALFLFDAAMWAAHSRGSDAWQRAMGRIEFSGSGIGLRFGQ